MRWTLVPLGVGGDLLTAVLKPRLARSANVAEKVRDVLRAPLGPSDLLISGLRVTDRRKEFEADAVLPISSGGSAASSLRKKRKPTAGRPD